ncbi:SCO family protein [Oceanisphaera pacifica]|uniref:SCO family protein n=1 Tax=Oceanisphaera pacifica TaxID=2818389 RepID=A0ABS3NHJ7_9GAMM|nr:SCO family protein [Oceanisphaera pacifica]MBO1520063.1 SCO family protein [Oceanisphaera pacifica]
MMKMLSALLLLAAVNVQAALPGDSIYQLNSQWQDRKGHSLNLPELAGKKQIIALIYTDCITACPVIVADMKSIQDALTPEQQAKLGFVLVSLTPARDTPKIMRHFAKKRVLDEHWTLLSGDDDKVRTLAMALNIQYMGLPDGEVAHSNAITVLDEQGRLQLQQVGLPKGPEALIKKMFD